MVETKNGNVQYMAKKLYINTNDWPDTWYTSDNAKFPFANIKRRVNHWIYCHQMTDWDETLEEFTTPHHVDCGKNYQLFVDEHNKTETEVVLDF